MLLLQLQREPAAAQEVGHARLQLVVIERPENQIIDQPPNVSIHAGHHRRIDGHSQRKVVLAGFRQRIPRRVIAIVGC